MADLEQVVRRIADAVLAQVHRVGGYVTKLAFGAVVITVVSLLLGIAVLDGGARIVWIVLAVAFGWISLSRVVRVRWNVAKLSRNRDALETDLLLALNQRPDAERVVIDLRDSEVSDEVAMEIWTREFASVPSDTSQMTGFRWLTLAVQSLKQLGVVLITTTLITAVFALLAVVFLIALALS
jgi:hypothetical protein